MYSTKLAIDMLIYDNQELSDPFVLSLCPGFAPIPINPEIEFHSIGVHIQSYRLQSRIFSRRHSVHNLGKKTHEIIAICRNWTVIITQIINTSGWCIKKDGAHILRKSEMTNVKTKESLLHYSASQDMKALFQSGNDADKS